MDNATLKENMFIRLSEPQKELLNEWLSSPVFLTKKHRFVVKNILEMGMYNGGSDKQLLQQIRKVWVILCIKNKLEKLI